jgi:hypothetical protein
VSRNAEGTAPAGRSGKHPSGAGIQVLFLFQSKALFFSWFGRKNEKALVRPKEERGNFSSLR